MAKPHLCPVCQGRGTVPSGFYSMGTLSSNVTPEQCRSCFGQGIVWDYSNNEPGPGFHWIGPVTCQDIQKTITRPNPTVMNTDHFTNVGDDECNTKSKS